MTAAVHQPDTEETIGKIERVVSGVLRVGVVASSLVIASGIAVSLVDTPSRRAFTRSIPGLRRGLLHPAGAQGPHSVAAIVQGLGHGSGTAMVMLGLLFLILTPVMRVAVSVVSFALEHDRRFVLITLAVLVVLIGSFAVGT
jgi:uncharacterized membrane protein